MTIDRQLESGAARGAAFRLKEKEDPELLISEGKQISRVLEAVEQGADTSDQASVITGLSVAICSNYLTELRKAGLVRIVKKRGRRFGDRGPGSHVYAPIKPER
jgi:Fic family protein